MSIRRNDATSEKFCEVDFFNLLCRWRHEGVNFVNISVGPVVVFVTRDPQTNEKIYHLHVNSEERIGSDRWYESYYLLLKCVYGTIRSFGLYCHCMERGDNYDFERSYSFSDVVLDNSENLRTRIPWRHHETLTIYDVRHGTYMDVTPIMPRRRKAYNCLFRPTPDRETYLEMKPSDDRSSLKETAEARTTLPLSSDFEADLGFVESGDDKD